MQKSPINLESLLCQLSEEKINLVVDTNTIKGGATPVAATVTDNSGGGWTITGAGPSLSWD